MMALLGTTSAYAKEEEKGANDGWLHHNLASHFHAHNTHSLYSMRADLRTLLKHHSVFNHTHSINGFLLVRFLSKLADFVSS